jgi:hypothetical protein
VQSATHKVQSTKCNAQSAKHNAQSTKHKAHREQQRCTFTAFFFTSGAFDGITIYAGIPRILAARASACAMFPDECVTTPFLASSSLSLSTALVAPTWFDTLAQIIS